MAQENLKWFYQSKKWRRLRHTLIAERGCICEQCGRLILNAKDLIVHHKITLNDTNVHDPEISLNPKLLAIVCWDCHNTITAGTVLPVRFDNQGYPLPPL